MSLMLENVFIRICYLMHRDAISVDNKCLSRNFNGSPYSLAYVK